MANRRNTVVITKKLSALAYSVLRLRNKPFDLENREWMVPIFDNAIHWKKVAIKAARQISKSTSVAAIQVLLSRYINDFGCIYISPSLDQSRKFSHDRIDPLLIQSPAIREELYEPDNVYEKRFKTGGLIYLTYGKDSADHFRGPTSDANFYDECQDTVLSEVEPVVWQTMSTSNYQLEFFTGTPKTFDNPLEKEYWKGSDQREWLVRCHHHSPLKFNRLGIDNIGKEGPVCEHCDNPLDISDGLWIKTNSSGSYPGFHISQLQCKWIQNSWGKLLEHVEGTPGVEPWSESKVHNEILGDSFDSSEKPTNEEMLKKACGVYGTFKEFPMVQVSGPISHKGHLQYYVGIDWGRGIKSATAVAVGYWAGEDKFRYVFFKTWDGPDCESGIFMPQIKEILQAFKANRVHVDFGDGHGFIDDLRTFYGTREDRVTTNYWTDGLRSHPAKWDRRFGRYVVNRTDAIANWFAALARNKIEFPSWKDFAPYKNHFLSIHRDYRKNGDPYFDHTGQDDLCHAAIYARLIATWSKGIYW